MIDVSGEWAGKIVGTNNADIFVEITQVGDQLSGAVRINDPMYGASVYIYLGTCNGDNIHFEMDPTPESTKQNRTHSVLVDGRRVLVEVPGVNLGHVSADSTLVENGRIEGKWTSTSGTGGVFWIGRTESRVETASKFKGAEEDNVAFIMMSISSDDPSLEDSLNAIKRATDSHGIHGVRVDEIEHSGRITDVILQKVKSARFLICDITYERPNVYYELGYAHGAGREVILVAKEGTSLHFDIKDYNVIFYRNYSELEGRVEKRVAEAIGSPSKSNES